MAITQPTFRRERQQRPDDDHREQPPDSAASPEHPAADLSCRGPRVRRPVPGVVGPVRYHLLHGVLTSAQHQSNGPSSSSGVRSCDGDGDVMEGFDVCRPEAVSAACGEDDSPRPGSDERRHRVRRTGALGIGAACTSRLRSRMERRHGEAPRAIACSDTKTRAGNGEGSVSPRRSHRAALSGPGLSQPCRLPLRRRGDRQRRGHHPRSDGCALAVPFVRGWRRKTST